MTGVDEALRQRPRGIRPAIPRLLGDERLARMAADGDERAFAAIYRRHGQELHRYCTAILGNAEDAADALQNTMVSALRALPGERREIALKPWLYRVAHNESISLLRQRRPGVELDPDRLTVPAGDADAATIERLRHLVADLGQLPDRQRGALVMRELSGLSFKEVGAGLGCSAQAARQLVYETRLALRRWLRVARWSATASAGRSPSATAACSGGAGYARTCATANAARTSGRGSWIAGRISPSSRRPWLCRWRSGWSRGSRAAAAQRAAAAARRGGTGLVLGGSAAAKSATAVLVAATIGAGTAQVTGVVDLPGLGDRGAGAERQSVSPCAEPAPNQPAERARAAPSPAGVPPVAGRQRDGAIERSHNGDARGRSGTPAGHAETPPGQTGTPAGPGGTPRTDEAAAGPADTPPGQAQVPPGQSDAPPGQVATPPGQLAAPPGQATTATGPDQAPSHARIAASQGADIHRRRDRRHRAACARSVPEVAPDIHAARRVSAPKARRVCFRCTERKEIEI